MADGLIFSTPPTPAERSPQDQVRALELQVGEARLANEHNLRVIDALELEVIRTRQLVALLMTDWGEHETYSASESELQEAPDLTWVRHEDGRTFQYRITVTERPPNEDPVLAPPVRLRAEPDPGTEPDAEDGDEGDHVGDALEAGE